MSSSNRSSYLEGNRDELCSSRSVIETCRHLRHRSRDARPAALAQTESKPKAPTPPALYDTKADARVNLKAAVARADRENARVLVMFSFNTCGWCHKLHGLFEKNAEIRKILHDEYTTVMVNTSAPHAAEMIAECKAVLSKEELQKGVGYPFLAVFDGNGKIVTAQRTNPLEEGDHHDPIKVKEFLTKWVAPAQDTRRSPWCRTHSCRLGR